MVGVTDVGFILQVHSNKTLEHPWKLTLEYFNIALSITNFWNISENHKLGVRYFPGIKMYKFQSTCWSSLNIIIYLNCYDKETYKFI